MQHILCTVHAAYMVAVRAGNIYSNSLMRNLFTTSLSWLTSCGINGAIQADYSMPIATVTAKSYSFREQKQAIARHLVYCNLYKY